MSSVGEKMFGMPTSIDLLGREIYGLAQVDRLLALTPGTARRWIEGYARGRRTYPPVVRVSATGDDLVTWGEFVETRLLAEYRGAGVPMIRMRPAVEKLRERFNTRYPLAHARPFLDVEGRELVLRAQEEVGLEASLLLVVARNEQLLLTPPAQQFVRAVEFSDTLGVAERLRPASEVPQVVMDPLRQFGEPVVRSVPTEVIAEQVRAGDGLRMISDLYDLSLEEVEAAVRYELIRGKATTDSAA